MKWLLVLGAPLAALGCTSVSASEVDSATLYFPPRFRYVDEPRSCFDPAERERALREYRERGADTLFEIVGGKDGTVRKARLLRTYVKPVDHPSLEDHARRLQFSPDSESEMYRAFYFPVRYRHDATFEWI